jgi:HTH-type transcriptional regulator / antitoxin HigA
METSYSIINAFKGFMATAGSYVIIHDEDDYNKALELLEDILESAQDTLDSPLNPLIDLLSQSIEKYEEKDQDLKAFIIESEEIPMDVALLKTLMSQYELTGSDFPDIGGKSMVSRVLRGDRQLSRSAIEKLSARFGVKPSMFFGDN